MLLCKCQPHSLKLVLVKSISHGCGFVVTNSQTALLTFTAVLQPDVSVARAPSMAYSPQSTMAYSPQSTMVHVVMFTLTTGMDARKECSPDTAPSSW